MEVCVLCADPSLAWPVELHSPELVGAGRLPLTYPECPAKLRKCLPQRCSAHVGLQELVGAACCCEETTKARPHLSAGEARVGSAVRWASHKRLKVPFGFHSLGGKS